MNINNCVFFFNIFMIVLFVLLVYGEYCNYKMEQKIKMDQLLDEIPCLCKHNRFMHGLGVSTLNYSGCYDFFEDDTRCKCKNYKRDNLIYLEKIGAK